MLGSLGPDGIVERLAAAEGRDAAADVAPPPLQAQARRLERDASGPSVDALIAEERTKSHSYGGRSVFGVEPAPASALSDRG